jgi:phosphatidylglycerophosphate synthase
VIGLVVVEEEPAAARRVAGLPVPLRALLALQAAGVDSLGFSGAAALAWVDFARRDDRVRVRINAFASAPAEPYAAVSGRAVIDTRSAKALVAKRGVLFVGREVIALHRGEGFEGDPLDDAGDGALEPSSFGVAVLVTDDASAARAEDALFDTLRKPQDGFISKAINRSLSLRVTRLLVKTSLRPNQLSVGILAFGAAGAWLAAQGTYGAMALGGLCFNAQSVLDGCDGELSRVIFRGSRLGEWIDTVGDDCTNYGFFAGAAWGLHRAGMGALPLWAGAVGLAAGVVASGIEYRYLVRIGSGDLLKYPLGFGKDPEPASAPETGVTRLLGLARPLFKRDFFVFATMLCTFAGPHATLVMLVAFAAGACITLSAVLRSEWARRGVTPGQESKG